MVVGGLGILLTAVVLSRGGGYFVLVSGLQWDVPLAIVGLATVLAASRVGDEQAGPVMLLAAVVVGSIAWNFLVYSVKFGHSVFRLLVPVAHPTGIDFRDGLYLPGKAFSNAVSGWPPFTLWIGKAFTAVGFSTGYAIQFCILLGFAAGAVVLSTSLARSALSAQDQPSANGRLAVERPITARQLGLVGGLWLFTSYGFMYEMERGQVDLYALFFALLAVWLVLRRPTISPWWPSLCLALAVNLKAYPAVLAVVLLWRYRWRAVVPLLVTNLALLCAAGPVNVRRFVVTQNGLERGSHALWWGNNSAVSLAHTLHLLNSAWPTWLGPALLALSAAVWIATLVVVMRRGWDERRAVLVAAACVPVMCTFPSISHDYKLVLLVLPLTVLAALTAARRRLGGPLWALLFMAIAVEFFLLARSSLVIAPSFQGSKFVLILGLQALLLVVAATEEQAPAAKLEESEASDADEASDANEASDADEAAPADVLEPMQKTAAAMRR